MTIVYKNNVEQRIKDSNKTIVEIGCGSTPRIKGAITVDIVDLDGVDIVTDVSKKLPFNDNSIDEIHSYHFLEHVEDLHFLFQEMHRVLKEGGLVIGTVPHFSNPYYYSDPTHKTFFGLYTFSYFDKEQQLFKRKVPTFYSKDLFVTRDIKLGFTSPFPGRYIFKKIIGFIVNISRYTKEFFEENLVYFIPVYEVYFELRKVKK